MSSISYADGDKFEIDYNAYFRYNWRMCAETCNMQRGLVDALSVIALNESVDKQSKARAFVVAANKHGVEIVISDNVLTAANTNNDVHIAYVLLTSEQLNNLVASNLFFKIVIDTNTCYALTELVKCDNDQYYAKTTI